MHSDRRVFLKTMGLLGLGGATTGIAVEPAKASEAVEPWDELMGVLVDTTKCIGCRRCEYACQDAAGFNPPAIPTFEDKSVMEQPRRPYPRSHTVINQYANPKDASKPIYNKFNCLHCIDPACMSACIVSAFSKRKDGPVVYDKNRCMGCRYCMVACPFEIPTYDYNMPLTPQVRKCNLCAHLVPDKQDVPACVKICPEEVMTYGKRSHLLEEAHRRIRDNPDVYIDHVYGEHEAGGTSWLWLSSVPFEEIGFKHFGHKAPPRLTEKIQHGEFKYFLPPLMWYGLLGAAMWLTKPEASEG
ncbi:MAG: 4Fe-4S dicluster domain-containing protein [Phycisphaerae bacterium]|nr:4Fe-4S dicluster domain-containing protein [Phycisphaerae bacterium]